MKRAFLFPLSVFIIMLTLFSCDKENYSIPENNSSDDHSELCDENCTDHDHNLNGKIFREDGRLWLSGGADESWKFDITENSLETERLKFGLGRETFQALIKPEYINVENVQTGFFRETDEFIAVHYSEGIKAFPIDLMIRHEVINDIIDNEPVFVAYCVLADYAGVLSRNYCGRVFTFAVSGYTYSEPLIWDEKQGFILWDRDTESLWWPLTNTGVSGIMNQKKMNKDLGSLNWERTTLQEMLKSGKQVKVLKYNQNMEPPVDYLRLIDTEACS